MEINGYNFLVGADPEFFVQQNNKPVSAHELIPGTKAKPFRVDKGAVQVDGTAAEFNIDPAENPEEFLENLECVMKQLKDMMPRHDFYPECVAEFGEEYLKSLPKSARILGCEPDYNAYTGRVNPTPNAKADFRTTSGHIHVGWTKDVNPMDRGHFEACMMLARAMDKHLGVIGVLNDGPNKRRELYGKAGAFRPKSYGMEYRVMSNKWLDPNRPHMRKFVYHNTLRAVEDLFENYKDFAEGEQTSRGFIDNYLEEKDEEIITYLHTHRVTFPNHYKEA